MIGKEPEAGHHIVCNDREDSAKEGDLIQNCIELTNNLTGCDR